MSFGVHSESRPVDDLAGAAVARIRTSTRVELALGDTVRFLVAVEGGRVSEVVFNAHRCVTLLACCEAIARLTEGTPVADAARLAPEEVLSALRGVAPSKADRASVALTAFRAALVAAVAESAHNSDIPEGDAG